LEFLGVDGRIILKWTLKKVVLGSVEWISVVENRNRWRGFVTTVTLRGVSCVADQLSALCTLSTVWND
jgi:hypothetical protein